MTQTEQFPMLHWHTLLAILSRSVSVHLLLRLKCYDKIEAIHYFGLHGKTIVGLIDVKSILTVDTGGFWPLAHEDKSLSVYLISQMVFIPDVSLIFLYNYLNLPFGQEVDVEGHV